MAVQSFSSCSGGDAEKMRQWMGPGQVDQTIRHAIHFCWMALPEDKRSVEEVEQQVRRLVDRALKDLREDAAAFGVSGDS